MMFRKYLPHNYMFSTLQAMASLRKGVGAVEAVSIAVQTLEVIGRGVMELFLFF